MRVYVREVSSVVERTSRQEDKLQIEYYGEPLLRLRPRRGPLQRVRVLPVIARLTLFDAKVTSRSY